MSQHIKLLQVNALLNRIFQVLVSCPRRIYPIIPLELSLNPSKLPPAITTIISHLTSDFVDLSLFFAHSNIEIIDLLHQVRSGVGQGLLERLKLAPSHESVFELAAHAVVHDVDQAGEKI